MPGATMCTPRSCLGSARCSGHTSIPISSTTRTPAPAGGWGWWGRAVEVFNNPRGARRGPRLKTRSPRLPGASEDQPQQEAKAESCGASKSSLTDLPIERIDAVLRPTGAQKGALDRLSAATKKAVHGLQAACPDEVPVTPVGRLQAMEKRLSAMLQA